MSFCSLFAYLLDPISSSYRISNSRASIFCAPSPFLLLCLPAKFWLNFENWLFLQPNWLLLSVRVDSSLVTFPPYDSLLRYHTLCHLCRFAIPLVYNWRVGCRLPCQSGHFFSPLSFSLSVAFRHPHRIIPYSFVLLLSHVFVFSPPALVFLTSLVDFKTRVWYCQRSITWNEINGAQIRICKMCITYLELVAKLVIYLYIESSFRNFLPESLHVSTFRHPNRDLRTELLMRCANQLNRRQTSQKAFLLAYYL